MRPHGSGASTPPPRAGRVFGLSGKRLAWHETDCWLVNTGRTGGSYGIGHRMEIRLTRALLSAALDGSLAQSGFTPHPIFKVLVPHEAHGVSTEVLDPRATWANCAAYDETARKLAGMFADNSKQYAQDVSAGVLAAGPDAG